MTKKIKIIYKRINITLPEDTLKKLSRIAEKEHRTTSNMISFLVEQYKEK